MNRQYSFGPPLWVIAFVLAFFSVEVSLALTILLAVFFTLPSTITRVFEDAPSSPDATPA